MSRIAKLRAIGNIEDGWTNSDIYEEITESLRTGEIVIKEFSDGIDYVSTLTRVYKVEEDGEIAYFDLTDFIDDYSTFSFYEVELYEKTIIAYRMKEFETEGN